MQKALPDIWDRMLLWIPHSWKSQKIPEFLFQIVLTELWYPGKSNHLPVPERQDSADSHHKKHTACTIHYSEVYSYSKNGNTGLCDRLILYQSAPYQRKQDTHQAKKHPLSQYMGRGGIYSKDPAASGQAETDCNGIIHHCHLFFIQVSHMLPKAAFIDGADLLQKDD